jgi:hypothetical protein
MALRLLILRRQLDMIDDDDLYQPFRGYKLQAKLLLQRCQERWCIRLSRCCKIIRRSLAGCSGVQSSVKSYLPVSPVLFTTGLLPSPKNGTCTKASMVCPLAIISMMAEVLGADRTVRNRSACIRNGHSGARNPTRL